VKQNVWILGSCVFLLCLSTHNSSSKPFVLMWCFALLLCSYASSPANSYRSKTREHPPCFFRLCQVAWSQGVFNCLYIFDEVSILRKMANFHLALTSLVLCSFYFFLSMFLCFVAYIDYEFSVSQDGSLSRKLPKSSAIKLIDFGSTAYHNQDRSLHCLN
jgi:hypothetical protein